MSPSPDRFRVRRGMAIAAFTTLVLTVPATFALILVGEEHMGDKLLQGSGVLAPVIACLTALVWKYFGDVTRTDLEEMRHTLPTSARQSYSAYDRSTAGRQYAAYSEPRPYYPEEPEHVQPHNAWGRS